MTPAERTSFLTVIGTSLAIGLLLSAAALVALQPLLWTDPVPSASALAAAHGGGR